MDEAPAAGARPALVGTLYRKGRPVEPYNPLDLEALGQSLLRELERRPLHRLDKVPDVTGSGVYALYYAGDADPYTEMGAFNRGHDCAVPIYLGKSHNPGGRAGTNPFEPVTDPLLRRRIREHRRSIEQAQNLNSEDFYVRLLVTMPIWIPLVETVAIRRYQPLWNSQLSGFGIHDPGSGREKQQRSQWDVLHPGRRFAGKLTRNEKATRTALLARMREIAQREVDAALSRLQELAE